MERKVIRTEADLLEHSYGVKAEADKPAPPPTAPEPAPPPAPEPPPPPPADPESDTPSLPPPADPEAAALVTKFVDNYSKPELVKLAEDNEIDSSGVKADIATRLVEAGWAPEEE